MGVFMMDAKLIFIAKQTFLLTATMVLLAAAPLPVTGGKVKEQATYVGSLACKKCHEDEYSKFTTYAKKAHSFHSIERLMSRLTPAEIKKCYSCHTTGYGKPGGFVSPEKTPLLKNAGCEVCHGPGSIHVKTQSAADIKSHLTIKDCEGCHTSERVKAFRYKPMIHGGAH
jgi:hypothetical protein